MSKSPADTLMGNSYLKKRKHFCFISTESQAGQQHEPETFYSRVWCWSDHHTGPEETQK